MRPLYSFLSFLLILSLFHCSSVSSLKQKLAGKKEKSPPGEQVAESTDLMIPDSLYIDKELQEIKNLHKEAVTALDNRDTSLSVRKLEEALNLLSDKEENDIYIDSNKEFQNLFTLVVKNYRSLVASENELTPETPPDFVQEEIDRTMTGDDPVIKSPASMSLSVFPVIINPQVERILKFYQTKGRKSMTRWLERSTKYLPLIKKIIQEEGLPGEMAYLPMIESGYNPRAYSRAHAVGFWQFVSATGRRYGLYRNSFIDDRKDPVKSTYAGVRHLKDLYNDHKDWYIALAHYNCSPRGVQRAIRKSGTKDYWKLRYLPRETRNYIPKLMAAILIAKNPEKYGFTNINYLPEWEYDEIVLKQSVDLFVASKCAETSRNILLEFNPELRSNITPPDATSYILRIPKGKKEIFERNLSKIPASKWVTKIDYRVRRGDTLSTIAKRFKTSIASIQNINKIRNKHRLSIGQRLIIPVNSVRSVSRLVQPLDAGPGSIPGMIKKIYTVKKGDTLGEIAEAYGTSSRKIRGWNRISYREHIYPRQKLVVWTKKGRGIAAIKNTKKSTKQDVSANISSGENIYTVKKGDTIYQITKDYNVKMGDIRTWNPDINLRRIFPGQKIYIKAPGSD